MSPSSKLLMAFVPPRTPSSKRKERAWLRPGIAAVVSTCHSVPFPRSAPHRCAWCPKVRRSFLTFRRMPAFRGRAFPLSRSCPSARRQPNPRFKSCAFDGVRSLAFPSDYRHQALAGEYRRELPCLLWSVAGVVDAWLAYLGLRDLGRHAPETRAFPLALQTHEPRAYTALDEGSETRQAVRGVCESHRVKRRAVSACDGVTYTRFAIGGTEAALAFPSPYPSPEGEGTRGRAPYATVHP